MLLASISGGTDIISCFALGNPLLPVYRGELQCRGLGMAVEALDDDGKPVRGEPGELSACSPSRRCRSASGTTRTARNTARPTSTRCPTSGATATTCEITEHGGVIIYGRSDATLNPGGVRIGTAEIYRQVEQVEEVLDCVAVGQQWDDDERVILFVKLREGVELDDALRDRIRKQIRANTTPRHVPAKILQVGDIPRTISGKISELAVRAVIHGKNVKNTDALANPEALKLFRNRAELGED